MRCMCKHWQHEICLATRHCTAARFDGVHDRRFHQSRDDISLFNSRPINFHGNLTKGIDSQHRRTDHDITE